MHASSTLKRFMRSTNLDALADPPWAQRGPQQDGPVDHAAVAVPETVQGVAPADGLCGVHTEPGGGQRSHGGQLVARQLEAGKPPQVLLDPDLAIEEVVMRRSVLHIAAQHEIVRSMILGPWRGQMYKHRLYGPEDGSPDEEQVACGEDAASVSAAVGVAAAEGNAARQRHQASRPHDARQ